MHDSLRAAACRRQTLAARRRNRDSRHQGWMIRWAAETVRLTPSATVSTRRIPSFRISYGVGRLPSVRRPSGLNTRTRACRAHACGQSSSATTRTDMSGNLRSAFLVVDLAEVRLHEARQRLALFGRVCLAQLDDARPCARPASRSGLLRQHAVSGRLVATTYRRFACHGVGAYPNIRFAELAGERVGVLLLHRQTLEEAPSISRWLRPCAGGSSLQPGWPAFLSWRWQRQHEAEAFRSAALIFSPGFVLVGSSGRTIMPKPSVCAQRISLLSACARAALFACCQAPRQLCPSHHPDHEARSATAGEQLVQAGRSGW